MASEGRKRCKKTNRKQQELYLDYLQSYPNFRASKVDPRNPDLWAEHWQTLANILNAHGPPSRSADDWRKLLSGWKNQVRCKARQVEAERMRSGGESSLVPKLNEIEERALQSFGEATVLGIKNTDFIGLDSSCSSLTIEPDPLEPSVIIEEKPTVTPQAFAIDNRICIGSSRMAEVKLEMPEIKIEALEVQIESPEMQPETPEVQIETPTVKIKTPQPKLVRSTQGRVRLNREPLINEISKALIRNMEERQRTDAKMAEALVKMSNAMVVIGDALLKLGEKRDCSHCKCKRN